MNNFKEFAKQIGLNEKQLNNIINYSNTFYNSFYLKKKSKHKKRVIDAPNSQLKAIQRWLLNNSFNQINFNQYANGLRDGWIGHRL